MRGSSIKPETTSGVFIVIDPDLDQNRSRCSALLLAYRQATRESSQSGRIIKRRSVKGSRQLWILSRTSLCPLGRRVNGQAGRLPVTICGGSFGAGFSPNIFKPQSFNQSV